MQAVPSLVGTGAVVAAGAVGLVFGQTSEPVNTAAYPLANAISAADFETAQPSTTPYSRPPTSSAHNTHGSGDSPAHATQLGSTHTASSTSTRASQSVTQTTPPKASSRRHSFIRQSEWAHPPISEVSRDSISSNGSWMRRLSIRPLSQHGSPRSSVGPDSPSLTFSHGSGAPMLSPATSMPPPLPRNRLVKRTTTTQEPSPEPLVRRGSRSQMPTLRRPATSHQRTATLYQQYQSAEPSALAMASPKYSLEQNVRPSMSYARPSQSDVPREPQTQSWKSFFHVRGGVRLSRENSHYTESSPASVSLPSKRLYPQHNSEPQAFLVKPALLSGKRQSIDFTQPAATAADESPASQASANASSSAEDTPTRKVRRSISMHFSSPGNWISRTGSLRRPKRGSQTQVAGKRHASDPSRTSGGPAPSDVPRTMEDIFTPPPHLRRPLSVQRVDGGNTDFRTRQRNASSPLPPLSRLSSFNVDLSRLGMPHSPGYKASQGNVSTSVPTSQSYFPQHGRGFSHDRMTRLSGSELETRGFILGDDDDTDSKSDTQFDSLRTAASNRPRAVETPLESMFDESPPSTAGNGKTKRLSIQEILGRSWDGDTRIMEEEESISTPIRGAQTSDYVPGGDATSSATTGQKDFGRPSLDDDDDDDWARVDDNGLLNHLSPPSSSVNSRRASPNLRMALAGMSPGMLAREPSTERPRSNVFDWSEPLVLEKPEVTGHSPRPKTVHGKQELDIRAGRPANRKGPTATHVRSQSVPVVPDPAETAKPTSKFGTWASGPKNVSEDWDDDFEFEADSTLPTLGKDSATSFSMVVPASIQATQPTVKAHSGQIRELSLLVNGLKRLCRHGRDLDLLGDSPGLWKEAEDIIALASPDEDDEAEESSSDGKSVENFDPSTVDERFRDEGFDAATLNSLEDPFEVPEPEPAKVDVVSDRPSGRRRSVFAPDDDIFGGNWPLNNENVQPSRPRTPERFRDRDAPNSAMIASVMEAMQQQRSASAPIRRSPVKPSNSRLFFDTNSLQELVKRANVLFHSLSEIVRRTELLTQSPARTPRHERHLRSDGSPAFTRVFADPGSSPPKRLPKSRSSNSGMSRPSMESVTNSGIGSRMQMMTVS